MRKKIYCPRVKPLINPTTNKPMVNAYIIYTGKGTFLQSYNNIIVANTFYGLFLDKKHYSESATTSRHRNAFLKVTNKEFKDNLDKGLYKFTQLNHERFYDDNEWNREK